jgi:hypothetical protein
MSITNLFTSLTSTAQLVLLKDNIIIQTNDQVMLHQFLQLIHPYMSESSMSKPPF